MIAVTEPPYTSFANLRIANIEAIFRSKAILLLSRQTSRDLFDIWYFIARFGKTMSDVVKEMMAVNKYTTAGQNLAWIKTAKQRSEEHTSELQSLMRISYAVFCLKKKKQT